jgi:hypothetical protein
VNTGNIRCGRGRLAPFPFTSMFQNGPRRQGFAPENLFKPAKDSPPPRTNRAPLPAPGRSENLPMRRERGQMQRPNRSEFGAAHRLPLVGPEAAKPGSRLSRNPKIRAPPVDDVNNLGHDSKCQRCLASTAIQIRRNALFTSPEYAPVPTIVSHSNPRIAARSLLANQVVGSVRAQNDGCAQGSI